MPRAIPALILVVSVAAVGCDSGGGGPRRSTPARLPATPCGTFDGRGCAPPARRVDLHRPRFSHPTDVTNPLFPIARLRSAVLLGHVDGKPFRTETTLLPRTQTIDWHGIRVRTLVSQYVAYLGGRLEEVALDRYAQADDGSVWYFGEDVFDYAHGAVSLTEGTWLAGRDGPAAMIMPAHPRVGDTFRTENVPGIVFEEVTVNSVGRTVAGPRGPVRGAIVGSELHSDGTREDKLFAPGYGEFRTEGGGDLEALAEAVPTDAIRAPLPTDLATLPTGTRGILESARLRDWPSARATLRRVTAAWRSVVGHPQPPLVAARLRTAMGALRRAVHARNAQRATQAAIDVLLPTYDLQLRYRPPTEIDAARFDIWTQQLRVHAAARDLAGATGDVAVLEWIRDRLVGTLTPDGRQELDTRLRDLRTAIAARNLPVAADEAARLGSRLRMLTPG
jgi:hypothetical protein